MVSRRNSLSIRVGNLVIGGHAPISVQSMTKTDTHDIKATINQINELTEAGAELVRVAVPDMSAAEALREIKKQISLPLAADVHFNYKLALAAIENGADKLRINPGTIGDSAKVKLIIKKAKAHQVPIRIGANVGSLPPSLVRKHGGRTPEALAEAVLAHLKLFEELDFRQIVVSAKASDVKKTIKTYQLLAEQVLVPYPFHIGITAAGTPRHGIIKSAIGIGALLLDGIGDTLRVSLTGEPVEEVRVGYAILKALGLRVPADDGPTIISCPTCGRCKMDLVKIATEVERRTSGIKRPITIAVMGCEVNGPGEAREADIGIAGISTKSSHSHQGRAVLFKKGKIIKKLKEEDLVDALLAEIGNDKGIGKRIKR